MPCPDENTVARLLAGDLPPGELADVELHLDQCPACMELLASLGRAYAPSNPPGQRPAGPPVSGHSESEQATLTAESGLLLAEIALGALHVVWTLAAYPLLGRAVKSVLLVSGGAVPGSNLVAAWSVPSAIGLLATVYVAVWAPGGALLALAAAWLLRRRTPVGRRLCFVHALVSLPSVWLTLPALLVLLQAKRVSAALAPVSGPTLAPPEPPLR